MAKPNAIIVRAVPAGTHAGGQHKPSHMEVRQSGSPDVVEVRWANAGTIAEQVLTALQLFFDAMAVSDAKAAKEAALHHWIGAELSVGVWVFTCFKPLPQPYGQGEDLPLHTGAHALTTLGRQITL